MLIKAERGFSNYLQISNGCFSENNYCLFSNSSEKRMRELFQLQPGGPKVDTKKKKDQGHIVGDWKQISDNTSSLEKNGLKFHKSTKG